MNRSWALFGVPWTPEEDAVVRQLYDQAEPLKLGRKRLPGRTTLAIASRGRHLGLHHGYRRRAAALGLLAAGVPYMQVYRETGVSYATLNRIRKELRGGE